MNTYSIIASQLNSLGIAACGRPHWLPLAGMEGSAVAIFLLDMNTKRLFKFKINFEFKEPKRGEATASQPARILCFRLLGGPL